MTSRFDPDTQTLLEPVTTGKLRFRSIKTGAIHEAHPEDTMLASEGIGEVDILSKYNNTINATAFDPANPRALVSCSECKRATVKFQRLGQSKKVIYACVCGNTWM